MIYNDFFINNKKSLDKSTVIFILLLVFTLTAYIFSFKSGIFIVSLGVGIASVVICVLFYYSFIFEQKKLDKLWGNIVMGISEEDTYRFIGYDDYTEHDGVNLIRVKAVYTDSDGDYERTLYFIKGFEKQLSENAVINVKTYQNIIIEIEGDFSE